jgi:hypothetical protein
MSIFFVGAIARKFPSLLLFSLYSKHHSVILAILITLITKNVLKRPLQTEIKGLCYLHGGTQSRHEH